MAESRTFEVHTFRCNQFSRLFRRACPVYSPFGTAAGNRTRTLRIMSSQHYHYAKAATSLQLIRNPTTQRSTRTNHFPSFFPNPALSIRFFSSNTIFVNFMVPSGRLELPRPFGHSDLNAARMPFRHEGYSCNA